MLLQTTATPTNTPASRRGQCGGLRQWKVGFFMDFLAVTAYWAGALAMVLLALPAAVTVLFFNPPG